MYLYTQQVSVRLVLIMYMQSMLLRRLSVGEFIGANIKAEANNFLKVKIGCRCNKTI